MDTGQPPIRSYPIVRIQAGNAARVDDPVAVETVITLFVNRIEVATLLCSPTHIKAMAVGFLLGEGVLKHPDDLLSARYEAGRGIVRLTVSERVDLSPFIGERKGTITSGCGKGQTYTFIRDVAEMESLPAGPTLSAGRISARIRDFIHRSETYRDTGGVHSAMLWDGDGLEVFCEDLGRHNAVDKVFGRCLLEGIDPAGKIMLSSGRISSEIALKCARQRVPLIISRNAPTTFSVQLAQTLDLTLVGFVRGDRMNVYTCPERVTLP
ncbi:MAG: formate dehydrogenase accessory sulfurtransferase FdhD [Nitrospirota bacterium]|nr:formate dehydrogenase accessory sulfurtransferase FdhD [Nitrospirota bacterium]